MSKKFRLLITCEHGGNQVPSAYAEYFKSHQAKEILKTHRGWDPGTLELASMLRDHFDAPNAPVSDDSIVGRSQSVITSQNTFFGVYKAIAQRS